MNAHAPRLARVPGRGILLGAGLLLAAAAAIAAPSTALLPGPETTGEQLLAAAVLFAAFAIGYAWPRESLFGLVVLVVLEGAIRKWVWNDVAVFLLKDFLALGLSAAVIPRLTREELRRPWWFVAPLAALLVLALLQVPRAPSLSQAVVGLRAYAVYVPLLWAAPALLRSSRDALRLLVLTVVVGAGEAAFALVQALSNSPTLNKLVSGALPAAITVKGVAYLRPSGTFMQVGPLAAFLSLALAGAFVLVASRPDRRLFALGLLAPAVIVWGVVYSSARLLLGTALLALFALALVLLARRRFGSLALVLASLAGGVVVLFTIVPAVDDGIRSASHWWRDRSLTTIGVVDAQGRKVDVRVKKEDVAKARKIVSHPAEGSAGPSTVRAFDSAGHEVVLTQTPAGGKKTTRVAITPKVHEIAATDASGRQVKVGVATPKGASTGGGFISRAADFNSAGGQFGLWSGRVKPQLDVIRAQRLGHGTGTMTLGSEYASPTASFAAESQYAKVAWELGLVGLAVYVWFIGAFIVAAFRGTLAARGAERSVAALGLGAVGVVTLWSLLTFAPDYPVVAILVAIFGGYAVALGSVSRGTGPERA